MLAICGKGEKQQFIAAKMIEDGREKTGRGGCRAQIFRCEAAERDEPFEPFRLRGEESQRRYGQNFSILRGKALLETRNRSILHGLNFPFVNFYLLTFASMIGSFPSRIMAKRDMNMST